jgi:hypothetical protein
MSTGIPPISAPIVANRLRWPSIRPGFVVIAVHMPTS